MDLELDLLTVVIRSARERTEAACRALIEQQLPAQKVFLLHEKPFAKAVSKMIEIGLDEGSPWTLAIDADVLSGENAIKEMLQNVNRLKRADLDRLYVYQGHVVCKLFGKPRQGGLHLYQTKHLPVAAKLIDPKSMRPESATYEKMNELGYIHFVDDKIYGLHDHQQYHADLFRKSFFLAKKFFKARHFGTYLPLWKEKESQDTDYRVMLEGWCHGLLDKDAVKVDIDFFRDKTDVAFARLGLEEKPPFAPGAEELNRMVMAEIRAASTAELKVKRRPSKVSSGDKLKAIVGSGLRKLGQMIES